MTVFVTGGKGFIGARVIKNLVERGEKIVCLEPKASAGRLGDLIKSITFVEGDILDYNLIADTLAKYKVDRVIHMVFFSAEERGVSERPEKAGDLYKQYTIMNTGTFHVFEAARLAGIKRVIYPSSIAYHGVPWEGPEPVNEQSPARPTMGYGIGKHLCEHLAREYNRLLQMEIITVRIPGVYGPGVRIGARGVNLIGTQGGLGNPVPFPYSSKQEIVLAHVDDIAEIAVRAAFLPKMLSQVYHIGGHYCTFGDMAAVGKKLMPAMQVTFNENFPAMHMFHIDNSLMTKEIGVKHRNLEDGYFELINITRKENNLPPIERK